MVTGYEVDMYHDISAIRRSTERIASALEALVRLAKEADQEKPSG